MKYPPEYRESRLPADIFKKYIKKYNFFIKKSTLYNFLKIFYPGSC